VANGFSCDSVIFSLISIFQFENGAFFKINKLVLVICISERQIERKGSGTSSAG
jgi:hypothetical protein